MLIYEPRYEKTAFCISENKDTELIGAVGFATRIVQSLNFLNPKFQAFSRLLWLHSPACVGPGRKPRRPVFSQWDSITYVTGPQSAVQSAFAIFDENPIEAESTVGSNVMTVPTSGVWTNIGDDFNVTTGEYTAPIDGTYVFILNVYNKENLMHHTHCYIRRNNEYVAIAYAEYIDDTANDHHSGTAATVLSLKQGDIVYAGECSKVDDLYSFTSFMGFLLAVDPSEEEK